ncbi:hypothetical protein [Thiomicrorhabdus sp. Milos-T2]|uniref:hypothetical protein n=1 Tax=Thiomicrorhabdus sp. Milos-T2 TaxID=90814 RepID=UPI000493FC41|nr:hypothetical protein [Thiomicrorhabdus sp. Milos-T2]
MQNSWFKFPILGAILISLLTLVGCSKDPVKITSAKVVSGLDKGSGNFDRVLQICFDKPLTSNYYHKIAIITKENVKITGFGTLRPLASDPDNKCHLRNVYLYIHKDSPVDARQLIKDYVLPGNIKQVLVQIYNEKPEGKELPIAEKIFTGL